LSFHKLLHGTFQLRWIVVPQTAAWNIPTALHCRSTNHYMEHSNCTAPSFHKLLHETSQLRCIVVPQTATWNMPAWSNAMLAAG
jgi:hypothetical protein